jgi:MFS family permease
MPAQQLSTNWTGFGISLNVSAGIGVLAMASPMFQEIFGGSLIGKPEIGFSALDAGQTIAIATIAAGLVGVLSLFNIAGRFFWASLSDKFGRRASRRFPRPSQSA